MTNKFEKMIFSDIFMSFCVVSLRICCVKFEIRKFPWDRRILHVNVLHPVKQYYSELKHTSLTSP